MKPTLTFEIELLSAYHISAGNGRGSELDSALLRDADGAPVIRGATLSGLLRDALYQLLQYAPLQQYRQNCQCAGVTAGTAYCGHAAGSSTPCPICAIFGTPHTPKRWRVYSARPVEAAIPVRSSLKFEDDARISQRIRINPQTRRTEPHKLFSQENGDQRLRFQFQITGSGNGDSLLDEAAFLTAAARHVRQLGRSRRRGQGECRIHLLKCEGFVDLSLPEGHNTEQALLKRLEERGVSGEMTTASLSATGNPEPEQTVTLPASSSTPHTKRMQIMIRLDAPVLLTRRGEAGNQFETLDFITGTSLWGSLAARAIEHNPLDKERNYEEFVQLFHRGQVRCSALYPLKLSSPKDAYPTFPAPLDLFSCKIFHGIGKNSHGAHCWATAARHEQMLCAACQKQQQRETPVERVSGFITLNKDPALLEPQKCYEMHTQINPESQRVQPGMLYGYVALQAGQYFSGELTFCDEAIWQKFLKLTGIAGTGQTFELAIGKAARRGYGRVTACLQDVSAKPPLWISMPFAKRVPAKNQPLTLVLTLLSDAIIPDDWGRFRLSFDADWLKDTLHIPELTDGDLNVFNAFRTVDGFNSVSGLPRQRDIALKAGSAVGMRLEKPLSPEQIRHLETLEAEGIGLRRREGFGRLVFNHPFYGGHSAIKGTSLDIKPEALQLPTLVQESYANAASQKFLKKWNKILDDRKEIAKKCASPEFTAIARWLHANCSKPLDELRNNLKAYNDRRQSGEIDQNLRDGYIPDYGARQKESKTDLTPGITEIDKILEHLCDEPDKHRISGVKALADRIATVAKLNSWEKTGA